MQYRYEQVAEIIAAKIRNGEWQIGQKIPGEIELAREYGVGRSTVRETLNILQQKGMIEKRYGSGTYVTENKKIMENPLLLLSSVGTMIKDAGYQASSIFRSTTHELSTGHIQCSCGQRISRRKTAGAYYSATPSCFPLSMQFVMIPITEVDAMETKDIILELRTKRGLSQDDLAEKVMVTRQAVSRWENGETVPNTDTLKLLSKELGVSINTLLGEPRKLICQCCGMPIEDDTIMGRDSDGALNEDYCKWCYADGTYTYSNMDDLIEVCVKNMVGENFTEEQARAYLKEILPKLDYWKRYEQLSDGGQFDAFKEQLIDEINALQIEGMPHIERLNALVGKYVNLEYRLPNGMNVKFLDDEKTYLGNQLECEFGGDRCFGVLANMEFILVSTYEAGGINPELVLYKKR